MASPVSSSVRVAFEVEAEMQDAPIKGTLKALFTRVVPLIVDDSECNVLIRCPCTEPYDTCFRTISILLYGVNRRLALVKKIWVEYLKFVSLDGLGRGVVTVVMGSVVLVPAIAGAYKVEELFFSSLPVLKLGLGTLSGQHGYFLLASGSFCFSTLSLFLRFSHLRHSLSQPGFLSFK